MAVVNQYLTRKIVFVESHDSANKILYLELIVHDKEGHSRGFGVSAVEEGDVAALPVHLREVDQGRVQSYTRAWMKIELSYKIL